MRTLTRCLPLFLTLCVLLPHAIHAQQSIVDMFERRSHTLDGYTMQYRLFVPADYDSMRAYPLVLTLHGAGERGSDNERHIRPHRLATSWADPVNQAENQAFVLAPQVPSGDRWTSDRPVDESAFVAPELTTLAILDSLEAEFNIDPERIYVTGLSLGGHATWDFIARLPNRFAAAIPMSGNADPTQADKLLHLPIWTFHGESDTVVRPRSGRAMIQGMEDLGRNVVYAECQRAPVSSTNFDCPDPMPTSELAAAIADRADLIMTHEKNVGHGPWSVWYDHPLLPDWLFTKQRVRADAITLTSPMADERWHGTGSVTWTAPGPETDSVEVWLSIDDGTTWMELGATTLGSGSYEIDTSSLDDAALSQVRVFVLNEAGRVYGKQTSAPFAIDNEGNATPYLVVDDEPLRFSDDAVTDELNLRITAADPEGDNLTADVFYSLDASGMATRVGSFPLPSQAAPQTLALDLTDLPNSATAQLLVEVTDGMSTTSGLTTSFVKQSPRETNSYTERIAGEGMGTITLHFLDPAALTNHRYRITFDDSDPSAKTYSVADLELATTVLTDVPLSDGIRESPIFDGMSLVVEDLPEGRANLDETGWTIGDTDLGVSISGGSVLIAVLRVQLLETEDTYFLTRTDAVADTSLALFGLPAQPLFFRVTAASDGLPRDVLFRDAARDGLPGNRDILHILEPDATGELAPAWEWRFTATSSTVPTEPGDTFQFVPVRKLSSSDVFEFIAMEGVATEPERPDADALTLQAYPNPFIQQTTLSYRLDAPAHVTLEAYDMLGRRLAVLDDEVKAAGTYEPHWKAAVASGLYLIRLTARPLDGRPAKQAQRVVISLH